MLDGLENAGLRWLAWERNCLAVMHERTPRWGCGNPDILGLTKARYLIEVEIKRSFSDFKANEKKRHITQRAFYIDRQPKEFFFLVPEKIAAKCEAALPEWAGLLKMEPNGVIVTVKDSPINRASKRLTMKEAISFFHCLSNQVVSFSIANEALRRKFMDTPHDNLPMEHRFVTEPIWSYSI